MVNITINLGGFFRAWKEWNESRETERLMRIARSHMSAALVKLKIYDDMDSDYYWEIDAIEVDIYTATNRVHCQEVMERMQSLAKKRSLPI